MESLVHGKNRVKELMELVDFASSDLNYHILYLMIDLASLSIGYGLLDSLHSLAAVSI